MKAQGQVLDPSLLDLSRIDNERGNTFLSDNDNDDYLRPMTLTGGNFSHSVHPTQTNNLSVLQAQGDQDDDPEKLSKRK